MRDIFYVGRFFARVAVQISARWSQPTRAQCRAPYTQGYASKRTTADTEIYVCVYT